MKVVADAGPLIHLSWIGRLDLLWNLFDDVLVPPAVRAEVLHAKADVPGIALIRAAFAAGSLTVQEVNDHSVVMVLRGQLDPGESEAIALVYEAPGDLLLVDDRLAREEARRRGLAVTGTIGILLMAKGRGLIHSVTPVLEELRRNGFWISAELFQQIHLGENE